MTSPDDTYRDAVRELQSRLGRPPTTRDPEYVRLGEECRLAWIRYGRAEETVLPPAREVNPLMDALRATAEHLRGDGPVGGTSTSPVRDGSHGGEEEPLRAPGAADNSPVAVTEPEEDFKPDSASQPAYVPRIRGWCSACGQYLARETVNHPILDADGTSHSHADPWELRPASTGTRGPSGGIMAECESCGNVWERPKQRGRPARMCEECRG